MNWNRYSLTKSIMIPLLTIVMAACTASREAAPEKPADDQMIYDESFDPLSLNDNDLVIRPRGEGDTGESDESVGIKDEIENISEIDGFRIQILATNNLETASLVEQEAAQRFLRDGHATYLVFEAPLYKIRIGDCLDRQSAEVVRDLAKSLGYEGAFIVKSKVQSSR